MAKPIHISNLDNLVAKYKAQICDRHKEIDAEGSRYWEDMAYGWALANDMKPEQASDFAYYVCSDLGNFIDEIGE